MKDILNGGSTAESSDKKKLEEQVKMTNVSCPMQVDEATMLNKLTIESDKVLYHYTIDESVVQMSALKEKCRTDEGKCEELFELLRSSLAHVLGSMCEV